MAPGYMAHPPGLSMLSSASNESKYLANSSMRGVMVRPRARRASRFFWPLPIGLSRVHRWCAMRAQKHSGAQK
eukprot:1161815-Pelagomonas_calceolata.AAC.8